MLHNDDYKEILRREFDGRVGRNPRYSLRAFARDIKMSPSRLSEVMNGGEGLSRLLAKKISEALDFSAADSQLFCDLVDSKHARSEHRRQSARERLDQAKSNPDLYQFSDDEFRMIADWYHLGILELMNLTSFEHDVQWIGQKLGISTIDAQRALDRLERLNLIQCSEEDIVLTKGQATQVGAGVSPDAMKRFHRQILELASGAMEQPREEREFGALLISISRDNIEEIKNRIREFRKSLQELANSQSQRDEVYVCSMQFFRAFAESSSLASAGSVSRKPGGKTVKPGVGGLNRRDQQINQTDTNY